jgi:hypothetical protein
MNSSVTLDMRIKPFPKTTPQDYIQWNHDSFFMRKALETRI